MKVIKISKGRSNKPKCVYEDNSECHVEGRWEGTVARDSTRLKRCISWWPIISLFICSLCHVLDLGERENTLWLALSPLSPGLEL